MATDVSTSSPGKMGWGFDSQTLEEKQYGEKKALEQLVAANPAMMYERAAKDFTSSPIYKKAIELQEADGIEDGFSFRYLEQAVFEIALVWLAQTIGSCVASGAMRAVFKRTLAQIMLEGDAYEFFGTDKPDQNSANSICSFAPYNYGDGRQIGNFDTGGDGSFCRVHIQSLMKGILPCWATNLSQYTNQYPEPLSSEDTYRKWGDKQYRSVRQNFLSTASDFKLTESIVVNSVDVSKTQLITHLKPQMICSGWGFAPQSQIPGTKFWTYKRSGTWQHNMTRQGYLKIKGNWYLDNENSWGMQAHKNGDYFLVPAEVDDQWVRDAEIQTIGELILPESKPQV